MEMGLEVEQPEVVMQDRTLIAAAAALMHDTFDTGALHTIETPHQQEEQEKEQEVLVLTGTEAHHAQDDSARDSAAAQQDAEVPGATADHVAGFSFDDDAAVYDGEYEEYDNTFVTDEFDAEVAELWPLVDLATAESEADAVAAAALAEWQEEGLPLRHPEQEQEHSHTHIQWEHHLEQELEELMAGDNPWAAETAAQELAAVAAADEFNNSQDHQGMNAVERAAAIRDLYEQKLQELVERAAKADKEYPDAVVVGGGRSHRMSDVVLSLAKRRASKSTKLSPQQRVQSLHNNDNRLKFVLSRQH